MGNHSPFLCIIRDRGNVMATIDVHGNVHGAGGKFSAKSSAEKGKTGRKAKQYEQKQTEMTYAEERRQAQYDAAKKILLKHVRGE